ncbi:MAG: NHLP family bacteriocin export ABC transporter peptidase/permease/ATPase subunit [Acidobacteriota bacterium]
MTQREKLFTEFDGEVEFGPRRKAPPAPPRNPMLYRIYRRLAAPFRRRFYTPTVLQMEAVECGAAVLGTVLAHYDRWVSLEELRFACGVSRDGSKASNVVRAARRYGLRSEGFRMEPEDLRTLQTPMVLHWKLQHFVVLEGFHNGEVYLNDPAIGPVRVSEKELDESFTGVVLLFEPRPDFQPGGEPPQFILSLRRRLEGTRASLLYVLLAGFALAIPGIVAPVFSKVFVDYVLLRQFGTWLVPLVVGMVATAIVLGALTWLQQSYLLRFETRLSLTESSRFLWHVLRLPVEFFTQRFAGDISDRVRINDRVARLLSRDLAANVVGMLMIVFFAVVLLQYDVVLTLLGIFVVSLNIVLLQWVSRRRIDGNRSLLQEQGKVVGTAIGGLQIIESVKASGGDGNLFERLMGYQTKVVNTRQELERYTQYLEAATPTLGALNAAVILGYGSLKVMDGTLTLGDLIAFQALMGGLAAPVQRLVSLGSKLQSAVGDMARLDDVLLYPTEVETEIDAGALAAQAVPRLEGRLELRGLRYGYNPLEAPLVDDLDLTLEPGARVALVGATGSGKSTVAKLVTGIFEPWSGEVLFDGKPRAAWPKSVLTTSVASVDQTIMLFEGTLRDNLTLWDKTLPLSEVVAAAKGAAIHNDIAARAGGYDSLVEEKGANFSGGQRQRLEIARALTLNPSILVLDEATNALDPATELRIDRHLRRRGCTCLIVAHRLSTIRDADEIIVLDRGRIVERGVHDELEKLGGHYAKLIASF